jgi:hypothetical protein
MSPEERDEYRARRKKGLRGQGEYPDEVAGFAKIKHHGPGTRKERRKVEGHGQGRKRRSR